MHDDISALCADNPDVRVLRGEPLMPRDAANFVPDGVHPNDEGFARYAENLAPALKALLQNL
jgi:lysophospholipase L1-like esterase